MLDFLDKKKKPKTRDSSSWGRDYNHERGHFAVARRPLKVICADCGFVFQPAGKLTFVGSEEMAQACKCGGRDLYSISPTVEVPSKKRKKAWKKFFNNYQKYCFK